MAESKNNPLTYKELCGMQGKPIWATPTENYPYLGDWEAQWVVHKDDYDFVNSISRDGGLYMLHTKDYSRTWIAYRNQPDENST